MQEEIKRKLQNVQKSSKAWKGHQVRRQNARGYFFLNSAVQALLARAIDPQNFAQRAQLLASRLWISLQIVSKKILLGLYTLWGVQKESTRFLRAVLLLTYLQILLKEKRLRSTYGRVLPPGMMHQIKGEQIVHLNQHIKAMRALGFMDQDLPSIAKEKDDLQEEKPFRPEEISHLVLTIAASIRQPLSEEDCLLSDRASHLLDTLACLKNTLVDQEARRLPLSWVGIKSAATSRWIDHLMSLLRAYRAFRSAKGISEAVKPRRRSKRPIAPREIVHHKDPSTFHLKKLTVAKKMLSLQNDQKG